MSKIHLAEVIEFEMHERGWSLDELTTRTGVIYEADPQEWGIRRLAIEMFLEVREPEVTLGAMDQWFAKAFDVDAQFFNNMHEAWRKSVTA